MKKDFKGIIFLTIRPKKVNYMFLRPLQPHCIKNFYCIPTDKCEKSSTHQELSVLSAAICLVY